MGASIGVTVAGTTNSARLESIWGMFGAAGMWRWFTPQYSIPDDVQGPSGAVDFDTLFPAEAMSDRNGLTVSAAPIMGDQRFAELVRQRLRGKTLGTARLHLLGNVRVSVEDRGQVSRGTYFREVFMTGHSAGGLLDHLAALLPQVRVHRNRVDFHLTFATHSPAWLGLEELDAPWFTHRAAEENWDDVRQIVEALSTDERVKFIDVETKAVAPDFPGARAIRYLASLGQFRDIEGLRAATEG